MTAKPIWINGTISPMFSEIHKGDHWSDGMSFRPEGFLDDSGVLKPDDHLIPFSIGKRRCLGETLAKSELFLFFTGLIQTFKFQAETQDKRPSED